MSSMQPSLQNRWFSLKLKQDCAIEVSAIMTVYTDRKINTCTGDLTSVIQNPDQVRKGPIVSFFSQKVDKAKMAYFN